MTQGDAVVLEGSVRVATRTVLKRPQRPQRKSGQERGSQGGHSQRGNMTTLGWGTRVMFVVEPPAKTISRKSRSH